MFGTAIGDALGWPVEFLPMPEIKRLFGDAGIQDLPHPAHYTDDTQMMRAVLEGLLRARPRYMHDLERASQEVAEEFIAWSKSPENNRAPGGSCMHGCRQLDSGVPWFNAGKDGSKGCGTAMRSMAYGIWFFDNPDLAGQYAAEHAVMTHRSREARAAAAAVAAGTAAAISTGRPGAVVKAMLDASYRWDDYTNRLLCEAVSTDATHDQILDRWRGWTGAEAVAASLYCYRRHIQSESAYSRIVTMAVNSPGDSDSLGAIAGALAGATLGIGMLPRAWVMRVEKSRELDNYAPRVVSARMAAFADTMR